MKYLITLALLIGSAQAQQRDTASRVTDSLYGLAVYLTGDQIKVDTGMIIGNKLLVKRCTFESQKRMGQRYCAFRRWTSIDPDDLIKFRAFRFQEVLPGVLDGLDKPTPSMPSQSAPGHQRSGQIRER